MIEIDGSQGKGGGQVLRTALSMSALMVESHRRRDEPVSFKEEEQQEEREQGQEQQEPSFQKVDKRHFAHEKSEPADEQETEAEAPAEQPVDQETEEAVPEVPLQALDVYDTLRFVVSLLTQQAWVSLGIQKAPGAEEVEQDLPQAKVAIDTLEFVIDKLAPDLEPQEEAELNSVLSNLRINYVKRA